MKHPNLSLALGDPKQSGRNHFIVELFLLSNNITSHTPDERSEESIISDDIRVMEMFNKSGWNDINHRMLLSLRWMSSRTSCVFPTPPRPIIAILFVL